MSQEQQQGPEANEADQCGAYKDEWQWLGKPSDWRGCSLPTGHNGNHLDYNLLSHPDLALPTVEPETLMQERLKELDTFSDSFGTLDSKAAWIASSWYDGFHECMELATKTGAAWQANSAEAVERVQELRKQVTRLILAGDRVQTALKAAQAEIDRLNTGSIELLERQQLAEDALLASALALEAAQIRPCGARWRPSGPGSGQCYR